jgi:KDO2-lipid IV(A) lauroyltransferase
MATRNRLARALASATSRVWFPMVLFSARAVPRRLMHGGGRGLAGVYYRFRPKYLRAARANLAVIRAAPKDSPEVRRLAFEMVASHFSAWVDFLRFATRSAAESALLVESVTGYSRIVEGRLAGKGVLLLTAHLGNWEIGGLMLAQVNQPIHVVLVPDIFPGVERERRRLHARSGVTEIRVDKSIAPTLAVLRALSRNGIVAMQGDRDFDNTGVALPFFGREAFFPRGPLRVAMASGATVLPAFIVRAPDGRYRAIVEEPLSIVTSGDRDAALRENLRRYVAILERYVREYPDQWYCFYPFWDDPSRKV